MNPEKLKGKTVFLAPPNIYQYQVQQDSPCADVVDNFAACKGREFCASGAGELVLR
jgi:hypothetical protein